LLGETNTTAYRGDLGKIAYDHSSLTNNPHGVTKTQVGLSNVDNTSDFNKPVSSLQQTALNGKISYVDTSLFFQDFFLVADESEFKVLLNLQNVSNTSDLNKPISTATQTALNGKIASSLFSSYFLTLLSSDNEGDLKSRINLDQVNNISDANKPISTATQTALNGKEPSITGSTTSTYFRGDKTFQLLDKSTIGLANVDNTSDLNKPISTATQAALDNKESTITASTTSTYYRGDKTFQILDKTVVGLTNVNNTSDANKPVSSATQTALNGKIDLSLFSNFTLTLIGLTSKEL
jgi:hypothetical protein